jgi:hypothetical protein
VSGMRPFTFTELNEAFQASFSLDTCSPDDMDTWSIENPSRGHCAVSALTVNDLFGGDLMTAKVSRDGEQVGAHHWNLLSGVGLAGIEMDMTRDQFFDNEVVGEPARVARPANPGWCADQYEMFRRRVFDRLGLAEPTL